jgi:adenylate cyclase
VEVNANVLWTILQNRALDSVPEPINALALLGLGALVLLSNLRLRPLLATCATVLAFVGYAALAQILFDHQIWLDLVGPLLAGGLVYVAVQAARVAESIRELRRVEGIFGRYVSHAVVHQLLGKTDALRLGGQRREISVLFSDIRGFTSFSEQLPPEEVGTMLNEYFKVMVAVIFAHGGTVDKFVGDAIMAVFNAPLDQPDHAERAVKTALAMQEATDALAGEWERRGRPPLRIGIGIHSGLAVVGSFGAEQRSDYTVVGDTVNVAARLEGMSKDLDCSIVISAVTAQRLPTLAPFEPLGTVTIRGREAGLEVYGVRR